MMDQFMGSIFAVAMLLAVGGCGEVSAKVKKADISVNSVKCDMCVQKVEKAVKEVQGVRDVSVDLDSKTASVVFEVGVTTIDGIEKAIAAAGFDANTMERDSAAYQNLPSCCQ